MESSEKLSLFVRVCHFFFPVVNVLRYIFCCRCVRKEEDVSVLRTRLFVPVETSENIEENTHLSMREINKIKDGDLGTSKLNIKADDISLNLLEDNSRKDEDLSGDEEFYDAKEYLELTFVDNTI